MSRSSAIAHKRAWRRAFVVIYFFASLNRALTYLGVENKGVLVFLHVLFEPQQGFANACIYGRA